MNRPDPDYEEEIQDQQDAPTLEDFRPSWIGKLATIVYWVNPVLLLLTIALLSLSLYRPNALISWRTKLPIDSGLGVTKSSPAMSDGPLKESESRDTKLPIDSESKITKTGPSKSDDSLKKSNELTDNTSPSLEKLSTKIDSLVESNGNIESWAKAINSNPQQQQQQQEFSVWLSELKSEISRLNDEAISKFRTNLITECEEQKKTIMEEQNRLNEKIIKVKAEFQKAEEARKWLNGDWDLSDQKLAAQFGATFTEKNDVLKEDVARLLTDFGKRLDNMAHRQFPRKTDAKEIVNFFIPHVTNTGIEQSLVTSIREMEPELRLWEDLTGAVTVRAFIRTRGTVNPIRDSREEPGKLADANSFPSQFEGIPDSVNWSDAKELSEGRIVLFLPVTKGTLKINNELYPLPSNRRVDVVLFSGNSYEELFPSIDRGEKDRQDASIEPKRTNSENSLLEWNQEIQKSGGMLNLVFNVNSKRIQIETKSRLRSMIRRAMIPENLSVDISRKESQ